MCRLIGLGRGFEDEKDCNLEANVTKYFEVAMRKHDKDALSVPIVVDKHVSDKVLVTGWAQENSLDTNTLLP